MDRPARGVFGKCSAQIAQISGHVQKPPEDRHADRHRDRGSCRPHRHTPRKPRRRLQGHCTQRGAVKMALHLENQRAGTIPVHQQRIIQRGKRARVIADIDNRTAHGMDPPWRFRLGHRVSF